MLTVLGFTALAGAGAGLRFLATDRWPGGHRGTLLAVSYTHLTLPTNRDE